MISIFLIIAAAVANTAAGFWDSEISEQGFAKKYQEDNSIITFLFGQTPSALQLDAYNMAYVLAFAALGFVGRNNPALFGLFFGAQLANAGVHVRSVFSWKKAFATNGASLTAPQTAWQKIFW